MKSRGEPEFSGAAMGVTPKDGEVRPDATAVWVAVAGTGHGESAEGSVNLLPRGFFHSATVGHMIVPAVPISRLKSG